MDEEEVVVDLRSRVSVAILANEELGQALLEVEELDGCITLNGNVPSEQESNFVAYFVSRQQGVTSVINNIICA